MILADPLDFTWTSRTPVAPTGQSPSGSRYRSGYRVDWQTGALFLLMVLEWL